MKLPNLPVHQLEDATHNFEVLQTSSALDLNVPFLNAKSPTYGANGGGTTDDTTALSRLINAINATNGTAAFIPSGTYKITSALPAITKPVWLIGAASGIVPATAAGTVLSFAAGIPGLQFAATAQDSRVSNLYLKSASSVLGTDDGISFVSHGMILENIVIDGFGRYGVNIDTTVSGNANNGALNNIRCVSNKSDGYHIAGGNSNVITFNVCSAVANGGWGFSSASAADLFLNAHTDSNTSGAYQDTGNGNTYILPYTEAGAGNNVTLSGSGTTWIEGTFTSSVITNTATVANVLKGGAWLKALRLNDPATSNLWAMNVGSFGAGFFSLANNSISKNVFDIDAACTRFEMLIPLLLSGGINGTTSAVSPAAGGAGALPATPAGYLTVKINGTSRQIPFY